MSLLNQLRFIFVVFAACLVFPVSAESRMAQELITMAEGVKATPEVKTRLLNDFNNYVNQRQKKVESITKTLDESGDSNSMGRWQSEARKTAEWAEKFFEGIEVNYKRTASGGGAPDLIGAARIREHNHFATLANSELAEHRDLLKERLKELKKKQVELDKKWSEFKSSDNAIDSPFQKTVKELNDLFSQVIEDEVRYKGKTTEAIQTFASRYTDIAKEISGRIAEAGAAVFFKDPTMGELAKATVEQVVDYNEALEGLWSNINSRMQIARRLIQTEKNILISFAGTRDDVESFVKIYHSSQVQRIYEQAKGEADEISGSENELAKIALGHTSKLYKAYEEEFKEFVTKYKHLFFGPLGMQALEELLEVRESEAAEGVMRSHKIAELLRQKYLTGSVAFNVSLDGLDDKHREHLIEEILKPEVEKTIEALNKLAKYYDTTIEEILQYRIEYLRDVIE